MNFRVVSVNAAGENRVNVSFAQVNENSTPDAPVFVGTGSVSLTLGNEEAKTYWPDQVYTMTLKAV